MWRLKLMKLYEECKKLPVKELAIIAFVILMWLCPIMLSMALLAFAGYGIYNFVNNRK